LPLPPLHLPRAGPRAMRGACPDLLLKLNTMAPVLPDGSVRRNSPRFRAQSRQPWRCLSRATTPLPPLVAIVDCAIVDDTFHARFSAVERQYLFRIVSRRAPLTKDRGVAWHIKHPLDAVAMQAGADRLLGKHDFTTFRSSACQADSPVKTLKELRVERFEIPNGAEFQFYVRARSFLHNQVRSFVGTLERVGAGALTPDDVSAALKARDRAACGPVCPPEGLYLADVTYPENPFA